MGQRVGKEKASDTAKQQNELKGYKNNLAIESFRVRSSSPIQGNKCLTIASGATSISKLATAELTDLNNATKAYSWVRVYCTTSAHIASYCLANCFSHH